MIYFRLIFAVFILFTSTVRANDVKIIELHQNKSLDQLVLEAENKDEEIQNYALENNSDQSASEDQEPKIQESSKGNDNEINTNDTENISEEPVTLLKTETIFDLDEDIIARHLNTIQNIKSKTLHQEFIKILSNIELEDGNISDNRIYFIIKKLYEIGEIEKAFNLIKKIKTNNIYNQENLNFFYLIELNYLYSSFKLAEVCELKSLLFEKSIILPENLLEKTDIFCLTLENKFAEARLVNSLLLESELETDQNFQKLFNYMILNEQAGNYFDPLSNIKSKELIFLYSAMLRINELPLDEDFIKVDPLSLLIPVILSESTKMEIRIKAANKAYYDDVLSINSLSALYQSVDFNAKQFSNPEETIVSLDSKELIMAYYYQLANMQIFPDERLSVILKYWNFAKKSGLQKIAYSITEQIIETFSPTSENVEFAMQIAFAHIANKNYDESLKWINLYEISNLNNDSIEYAKFLINLNKNDNLDTIINYLSNNYTSFENTINQNALESLLVLIDFLNIENVSQENLSYINISDARSMPSYFLMRDIKYNIKLKNDLSVFMLSLISMYNKSWTELHPEHLKLILNSYYIYENKILIKQIILEILNDLEIF